MQGGSRAKSTDHHPQDPCIDSGLSPDLPTDPLPPFVDYADLPPYPLIPRIVALVDQSAGVGDSQRCPQRGDVAPTLEMTDKQGSSRAVTCLHSLGPPIQVPLIPPPLRPSIALTFTIERFTLFPIDSRSVPYPYC